MRLALQLALTFGLLAAASSAALGLAVRTRLKDDETARFRGEVHAVCQRMQSEIDRQSRADLALVAGACRSGALVERVGIALDQGAMAERRLGFAASVKDQREAMGLDELVLAVERGELVGADPPELRGLDAKTLDELVRGASADYTLRTERGAHAPVAVVSRCRHPSQSGRLVGLVGARHVGPLLERLAANQGVRVVPTWPGASPPPAPAPGGAGFERASCTFADRSGGTLAFDVLASTAALENNLAEVDRTVFVAAFFAASVAFLVAIALARNVSRPLADLAAEAGKVAAGEARPLAVAKGTTEVRALVTSFDSMLQDLAMTRGRLAAASRVAAWREVARRVAHEVKNPLAPIRAAVETLRRLRGRGDPRFDDYFDEATRTVLDEVHRISNIVTEFTRFARLPEPRFEDVDLDEVVRHVVAAHKPAAGDVILTYAAGRRAPTIRADRDQLIQILTNLVQNALEAVAGTRGAAVSLTTDDDGRYVSVSVADNGEGVPPEVRERLFEPYATTKASGTGLGLAIAQRIALEHDGELSYVGPSAAGRGAVFRLLLPLRRERPTGSAAS